MTLEEAKDQFAGMVPPKHTDHPIGEFLRGYTESEDGEITTDRDETKHVSKKDLRDAFNTWAQINIKHISSESDKSVEDYGLKTYKQGGFWRPLKKHAPVDLESGRPTLESGKQQRTWFGIELTEEGKQLVEVERDPVENE